MEKLFTVVEVRRNGGSAVYTAIFINAIANTPNRIDTFIGKHKVIARYQTDNSRQHWKEKPRDR